MLSSSTNTDDDENEAGAVVNFLGRSSNIETINNDCMMKELELFGVHTNYTDYCIKQYAQRVIDYSSQYGSNYSISYTASNITGRPTNFPDYGDFPEAFAMRSYGKWWQKAPSGIKEIQRQNLPVIPAEDFIVVSFEDYLIPYEVTIFETYTPGAVVRIWAYTIAKTWFLLWEASEECFNRPPDFHANKARRFSPPLRKCLLPTKIIRLEFNHSRLSYFTEIDALLLGGRRVNMQNAEKLLQVYKEQKNGSILRKLQNLQFRPTFRENYKSHMEEFLNNDFTKYLAVIEPSESTNSTAIPADKEISFMALPFEIVLNICRYLDLISLFRIGAVSRFFYDVSTDAALYQNINLKPYWHLATTELLCSLAKRAKFVKQLDLSWCGLFGSISPTEFKKFIQQRGDSLTHLRLNSCSILTSPCIETIGIVCDNLKELSLRNYSTDEPVMFFSLMNLKNLERLDLFQTVTDPDLLLTMLENNRNLKHLNLSSCGVGVNMDQVAHQIGTYNKELISLDIWKSHYLTGMGLCALAQCHNLEELDMGWCLRELTLGASFRYFLINCPKLKKLFMATCRGITDQDVRDIAYLCPNLEQLDLMGIFGITKERYLDILTRCTKLQLLDVSFCDNIDIDELRMWARSFDKDIKCTHIPVDRF